MSQPTLNSQTVSSTIQNEPALPAVPIQFMPVDDLTTFRGEVAVLGADFVYHFFVNAEIQAMADPKKYWFETFPEVMSATAQSYFKSDHPRLVAAYTEEQASWWFRANGFGLVLGPQKLALGFCDALDAALDAALKTSST